MGSGFAHAALENGIDVGEEEKFRVAIGVGNLGLECGKDVEIGLEGFGFVEVVEIGAFPEEAFAGRALDAAGVDLVGVEDGFCSAAPKSSPTTAMTRTWVKIAGGQGEIGCCAAKAALPASCRGFNGVKCDAAYYGNCHVIPLFT